MTRLRKPSGFPLLTLRQLWTSLRLEVRHALRPAKRSCHASPRDLHQILYRERIHLHNPIPVRSRQPAPIRAEGHASGPRLLAFSACPAVGADALEGCQLLITVTGVT